MKRQLQTPSACSTKACRPQFAAKGIPALPVRTYSSISTGCLHLQHNLRRSLATGQQCSIPGGRLACAAMPANSMAAVPVAEAVQSATSAASAAVAFRPLPFAALSRVLLTANNSSVFRTALNKRQPVSGPMGLLLFLLTLMAASVAAIRGLFVKKSKSCKTCRGFGLQRCRLCLGSGRVDWAAKLKHFDVCPLCMNKRFIICAECGGHYHRPMFSHRRRQVGGALEPAPGMTDTGSFDGPIVLNLAMAGAAAGTTAGGGNILYRSLQSVDGGAPGQIMSTMTD